jgi:hypothetical protein
MFDPAIVEEATFEPVIVADPMFAPVIVEFAIFVPVIVEFSMEDPVIVADCINDPFMSEVPHTSSCIPDLFIRKMQSSFVVAGRVAEVWNDVVDTEKSHQRYLEFVFPSVIV